jgi:hypothetical protein
MTKVPETGRATVRKRSRQAWDRTASDLVSIVAAIAAEAQKNSTV